MFVSAIGTDQCARTRELQFCFTCKLVTCVCGAMRQTIKLSGITQPYRSCLVFGSRTLALSNSTVPLFQNIVYV